MTFLPRAGGDGKRTGKNKKTKSRNRCEGERDHSPTHHGGAEARVLLGRRLRANEYAHDRIVIGIRDKRMSEQVFSVRPQVPILRQAHCNEVDKVLAPLLWDWPTRRRKEDEAGYQSAKCIDGLR